MGDAPLADVGRRAKRRQMRAHQSRKIQQDAAHRKAKGHPAITRDALRLHPVRRYKAVPEAELAVVPPFRDENGEAHMRTVNQTIQFVVFDGAEHADNVIKLLNYLATEEGMMLVQYGIEGTHWEYDEEGNIVDLVTEDTNLAELGRGSYAWVHRLSYFGASFSSDYDDERAVISAAVEPSPVMPTTESYPDFGSPIGKLITTYTAELICNADIDFDATFEQFVQEWNEQGGAIWTEEINECWDSRSN